MAALVFFARRCDEVVYVTARHCLTKRPDADIARLAERLHIPYTLTASTMTTDDYVQFDEVISLKHYSDDIPGQFVDVLVMTIRRPADASHYETLLARAVKLPPNGRWLDNFVQHQTVKPAFDKGKGIRFTAIGYPKDGTASSIEHRASSIEHRASSIEHRASSIEYPIGQPVQIVTQAAKIDGYLGKGTGIDRYMLNDVSWDGDLNGFSGSPIIVGFKNEDGHNYALAGMLVSGGEKGAIHPYKLGHRSAEHLKVLACMDSSAFNNRELDISVAVANRATSGTKFMSRELTFANVSRLAPS